MLAKEYKLADILDEVQKGLPDGERVEFPFGLGSIEHNKLRIANSIPKEEQIVHFIAWKQIKWQLFNNLIHCSKRSKFRESFRIALETTIPLDEKEELLIKKAKETVASSDERMPNVAVYEIHKFASFFETTDLRERVLDSLTAYQQGTKPLRKRDKIPANSLPAADINLIREACSNERFGAAFNLAMAQTEENFTYLLNSVVPELIAEILKVLRFPAAVENEYMRAKSRFANFENCQKKLPKFMNLYSILFQLRCERAKTFRSVSHLSQQYRKAFEEDLLMLDNALGISDELILRRAFFKWLKKEYFNNVQEARIELFESWVEDNPREVGLALAHRSIYSAANLVSLSQKLQGLCSLIEPFGAEEECLLSQARMMPKGKSEIESSLEVGMSKINRNPAPAA